MTSPPPAPPPNQAPRVITGARTYPRTTPLELPQVPAGGHSGTMMVVLLSLVVGLGGGLSFLGASHPDESVRVWAAFGSATLAPGIALFSRGYQPHSRPTRARQNGAQ